MRRGGACFSVTARLDPAVKAAIAAIGDAWTPIRYPRAVWDDQLRAWVSDAEVAETGYTAFASKKGQSITARLIVRRVKDLSPKAAAGQGELLTAWRYHAVFTDSPFTLLQAEEQHRDHAVIEQAFADWADGPITRLPQAVLPLMPPGSPWPPSPATCCAPPGAWPRRGTARPAAPPSALT